MRGLDFWPCKKRMYVIAYTVTRSVVAPEITFDGDVGCDGSCTGGVPAIFTDVSRQMCVTE